MNRLDKILINSGTNQSKLELSKSIEVLDNLGADLIRVVVEGEEVKGGSFERVIPPTGISIPPKK